MNIRRTLLGTSRGHAQQGPTPVESYTLDAGEGFAIEVWTLGATLVRLCLPDRNGRVDNVVLRLPDLASYEDRSRNPYLGCTMGRYARCIAGGAFRLDGVEHRLSCNYGQDHFHGGPIGFDRHVWRAEAEQRSGELLLWLRLDSPDGDQGYPGALAAEVLYRWRAGGRLSFEYSARTTQSTVVALTNHAFWNLAGGGRIDDHLLALHPPHVLLVDDALIPTGEPRHVSDTALDYRQPRRIAGGELDHCFVWAEASPTHPLAAAHRPAVVPVAELYHEPSGRQMRVSTDQPGLQVYSGELLAEPRSGLCLQTGAWPNSPIRADYPSSRLDPGDTYRHTTVHEFACG